MLKKFMITAATAALIASSASAQSPAPPMSTTPEAGKAQIVSQQTADQMLASKFKGTDVIGADNVKIGDVNDILFDKDAKVLAYVVGVGGFLGIGSKDVALAPSAFQVVAGDTSKHESDKLRLSMTKDELKQAANFEAYKAPSSTTGSGAAGGGMVTRPLSPAHPTTAPK